MLKIITFSIFLLTIISACSCAQDGLKSSGIITGYDLRECACCGGFFVEIDSTTYRFTDLPVDTKIDLSNPEFPVKVKLDWVKDSVACMPDEIIVQRIEKE